MRIASPVQKNALFMMPFAIGAMQALNMRRALHGLAGVSRSDLVEHIGIAIA
jgi:hypothetical protein